jgi:hypothetical protein
MLHLRASQSSLEQVKLLAALRHWQTAVLAQHFSAWALVERSQPRQRGLEVVVGRTPPPQLRSHRAAHASSFRGAPKQQAVATHARSQQARRGVAQQLLLDRICCLHDALCQACGGADRAGSSAERAADGGAMLRMLRAAVGEGAGGCAAAQAEVPPWATLGLRPPGPALAGRAPATGALELSGNGSTSAAAILLRALRLVHTRRSAVAAAAAAAGGEPRSGAAASGAAAAVWISWSDLELHVAEACAAPVERLRQQRADLAAAVAGSGRIGRHGLGGRLSGAGGSRLLRLQALFAWSGRVMLRKTFTALLHWAKTVRAVRQALVQSLHPVLRVHRCFGAWRLYVQWRAAGHEQLDAAVRFRRRVQAVVAVRHWRSFTVAERRFTAVCTRTVAHFRNRAISRALNTWVDFWQTRVQNRTAVQKALAHWDNLALSSCFATWCERAAYFKHKRESAMVAARHLRNLSVGRALNTWVDFWQTRVQNRTAVQKALAHWDNLALSSCFATWCERVVYFKHERQCAVSAVHHLMNKSVGRALNTWVAFWRTRVQNRAAVQKALVQWHGHATRRCFARCVV